jgi:hypothetical protein
MKKPFPKFDRDEKLEAFLETADLDAYDLTAGALPRDEWFERYERTRRSTCGYPAVCSMQFGLRP